MGSTWTWILNFGFDLKPENSSISGAVPVTRTFYTNKTPQISGYSNRTWFSWKFRTQIKFGSNPKLKIVVQGRYRFNPKLEIQFPVRFGLHHFKFGFGSNIKLKCQVRVRLTDLSWNPKSKIKVLIKLSFGFRSEPNSPRSEHYTKDTSRVRSDSKIPIHIKSL